MREHTLKWRNILQVQYKVRNSTKTCKSSKDIMMTMKALLKPRIIRENLRDTLHQFS